MYHNVLVPLALADAAQDSRALQAARTLASPDARLVLLHVLEEIPAYASSYLTQEHLDANKRDSQAALEKLDGGFSGHEIDRRVIWGHAARTILEQAEETGADCIVMHSHHPEFGDWLIGSTAAKVVRHAACSVHVLR